MCNALRCDLMRSAQQQQRVDRRMRAAAARVLLHPEPRPDDVVGLAPIAQDDLGVESAGAVEHHQKTLLVFERRGVGGKAVARQHRCEESVAGGIPDMQRFCHRAEIGLDAGGQRGGDRQCLRGLRPVEPEQVA